MLFEVAILLDFGVTRAGGDDICAMSAYGISYNELSPSLSSRFRPLRVLASEEPERRVEILVEAEDTVIRKRHTLTLKSERGVYGYDVFSLLSQVAN